MPTSASGHWGLADVQRRRLDPPSASLPDPDTERWGSLQPPPVGLRVKDLAPLHALSGLGPNGNAEPVVTLCELYLANLQAVFLRPIL